MSRYARTLAFAPLTISLASVSTAPAIAQAGETTSTPQQLAIECANAKAELASIAKSGGANLNEERAAAEQQVILTCRPNVPPPKVVYCGTAKNGAGTAQVDYLEVYISSYARWCVDPSVWATYGQSILQFLSYYDTVVPTLSSLFGVTAPTPVVIEVTTPNGGVFCDCGPIFGDPASIQIAGSFFSDPLQNPKTGQNVPGFWGYLILVHESINAYTGQIGGGGWPTDWWADDRSPFPNALDVEVMRTIGNQENNSTLQAAANAQYERFADPSQPNGYDPETGMYVDFFNKYGGFAAYSRFFQLVQNDGIKWPSVSGDTHYTGDNNWSAQLSEYVIAYLSMAFGTTSDLTPTFVNAGVGKLTATMSDGTKILPYTVDSGAVKTIADAHCSIAAATRNGRNVSSQLSALQSGNYKNAVATGGTSSTCPSECSWSQNKCVAKW